tara:strand:+ start:6099 stop:6719 length:621 start_codon:yes stop_codon:yes gene_type:complete
MVVVSLDESNRGGLLGFVRCGAVIWDENKQITPPITVKNNNWDSKKISPKNRKILSDYIKENALAWAIGSASPQEIDEVNILKATMIAFHRALDKITIPFDEIHADGNRFETYCGKETFIPHKCFVKGDATHVEIGMASILAKVAHDEYIDEICEKHPDFDEKYGLKSNHGYGTKRHIEGIIQHGFTPYHRKSFKVKQIPPHLYHL